MEGCNTPRPELQGWAGSRTDRPAPPEISLKPPDRVTNRNKVLASSFFFMFGGALQHILLSSSFSGRSLPTPTQFWSYSHRGCAWERGGGAHAHMKHRRVTSRELGKLVVVRRQKGWLTVARRQGASVACAHTTGHGEIPSGTIFL
jgi:hypothetical protein